MDAAEFLIAVAIIFLTVAGCVLFGIIAGYPTAHWISQKMAEILSCLPMEKFTKPQPALGIPATKVKRGDLQGAVESYEELLVDHPHEKEIYFRLLEIARGPMRSSEYAEEILQRGLLNLTRDSERRALLHFSQDLEDGGFKPLKYLTT